MPEGGPDFTAAKIGPIELTVALLPLAPVGVWIGVRMAKTISPLWFYRFLYGGMQLTGLKLLWDGWV